MNRVILLQKRLKGNDSTHEFQYAMKLPALVHEIGHMIDAEQKLNIRFSVMEWMSSQPKFLPTFTS